MNKKNNDLYNEMLSVASNRRTAKHYDMYSDVDEDTMRKIYEFSKTSPTSMGLELTRIVNISRDSKYKKTINDFLKSFNQERGFASSNLGLIVSKNNKFFNEDNEELINISKRNVRFGKESLGIEFVDGMEKPFLNAVLSEDHVYNGNNNEAWTSRQSYIHLGYILLGASMLGVETTTIEGFEGEKLNSYLREEGIISDDEKVNLIVAFGYVDPQNEMTFVGKKQLRKSIDDYVDFIK